MSVKFQIQLEADAVTESTVTIPFDFHDRSSLPPDQVLEDNIVINPITVRTYFKLKPLLLKIDKDDFNTVVEMKDDIRPDSKLVEIMDRYDSLFMDIICIGLHNQKSNPPAWFREMLVDNCIWKDIYILLNAILYRIGYNPFCKSITTLRSVSPLTEAELIAAQKNLESWTSQ